MKPIRRDLERNFLGFTLVEVALTVVLSAIVGMAVYSVLSSGLRSWQRVQREIPEEDVTIFFDKFRSDVESSLVLKSGSYQGNATQVSWSALVAKTLIDGDSVQKSRLPGMIEYQFDASDGRLMSLTAGPAELFQGKAFVETGSIDSLESVDFSFYYYEPEKEAYLWSGIWPPEDFREPPSLPLAIRVVLNRKGPGEKRIVYSRTFAYPLARYPQS